MVFGTFLHQKTELHHYPPTSDQRKLPNTKMTRFFEKVFLDMGAKVGFTNCDFEKLCFLKTLFVIMFKKTQQLQKKL